MEKISFEELLKKYQVLLEENTILKTKIKVLELGSEAVQPKSTIPGKLFFEESFIDNEEKAKTASTGKDDTGKLVNNYSDKKSKIILFMSLFKGREDVYAKRWQNKKGMSGYSPVCLNEWKSKVCLKPRIKCSQCTNKSYAQLNEDTIEDHLIGKSVVGIYPMCIDETCYFLAIDFDDEGWEKDVSTIKKVCKEFEMPAVVERSRSGNGAHVWFFFKYSVPAILARKFGTALLTYSMNKRYEITFKSYDRLFPNQNTIPKGGFGNLIALPLQMSARQDGNSIFIDENLNPYTDQWGFLSKIQKLSETDLNFLISNAKYVYGLTATPMRKDGHHPIIFFYCGPVRFKVDDKKEAEKRPFDHYIIPRFSYFRIPSDKNGKELSIQEIYSELIEDEIRNQLIVDDVLSCYGRGRNSLVLTERTAHVESLTNKLKEKIPDVIALTGGMSSKKMREVFEKISTAPTNKPMTLVATGKFVGEGFDEPRLDTLFLAMPISWKGTLQQYAGRLHRLYEGKNEVQIYDYVDIQIRMLEKMYGKRLKGYASIGYMAKGEIAAKGPINIIFDNHNFFPVYTNDITNATIEVLIVSPFVTSRRIHQMMHLFNTILKNQINVIVITRPLENFKDSRRSALKQIFSTMRKAGINVLFRSNIHQKFAIIDKKIAWYGSINLLSFGSAEESIMRLVSGNIAYELLNSVNKNWESETKSR